MKKITMYLLIIVAVSIVAACSSSNTNKEIKVQEMKSFSEVHENSLIVISDSKDVQFIEKAFHNAEKRDGIVDMADPQYKVELDKESYYLWLNAEFITIMNTKDTNTIYKINAAQEIAEILFKDS